MRHRENKYIDKSNHIDDKVLVEDIHDKRMKKSFPSDHVIQQRIFRVCIIFIIVVVMMILAILYFLYSRLGIGKLFPVQAISSQSSILSPSDLKIAATLQSPPGNIAISSDGSIYFTFHPEYHPNPVKVAKIIDSHDHAGAWKSPKADHAHNIMYTPYIPFPSMEFQQQLVSCLGMRIDRNDRLWLLDFGQYGIKSAAKMYVFDQIVSSLPNMVSEYKFPSSIAGMGSMLNDFQVDPEGRYVYIADTSLLAGYPALIVYDIHLNSSYRLLSRHDSMYGESVLMKLQGYSLQLGPFGMNLGVDSIALSRDGVMLYYGALSGNKLYAIATNEIHHMIDMLHHDGRFTCNDTEKLMLASSIIVASDDKPVTDGLSSDNNGNIWLTAVEHSAIAVIIPSPSLDAHHMNTTVMKVIEDDRLRWPDGLSFGPAGLYITTSALHLRFAAGEAAEKAKRIRRQTDPTSGRDLMSWKHLHGPFYIYHISAEAIQSITGDIMPYAGH